MAEEQMKYVSISIRAGYVSPISCHQPNAELDRNAAHGQHQRPTSSQRSHIAKQKTKEIKNDTHQRPKRRPGSIMLKALHGCRKQRNHEYERKERREEREEREHGE